LSNVAQTKTTQLLPRLDRIRIYYHNETTPSRAYPFDNDSVTVKAIVWANDGNGTKTYCDAALVNDGYWYEAGKNGADNSFPGTPTLPANTIIYSWPSSWQTPSFNWTVMYHHGSSTIGDTNNRNYWYATETSTHISGWGTTRNYDVGVRRYNVIVTLGTYSVSSPNSEYAARISIRNHNTPQGYNDRATQYLRWLTMYLQTAQPDGQDGIPYEWGGHWFGGKTGNNVGGSDSYDGYGIDCSGLVSCGARFAGYGWNSWRKGTGQLPEVSDGITEAQIQPGDILNKPGSHVATVYDVDRSNPNNIKVRVIEAAGGQVNKVWITQPRNLKQYYLSDKYIIRRLR
ncbi:MAG: hypothetical protein AAB110_07610, partial [Candidatus Desantisbacteria bacterium]